MLMVEENHASGSKTTQSDNRMPYTEVGYEVGRHTREAADKSRTEGTTVVPTAVLDPPQAGGVKLEPRTGSLKSTRDDGIVTRPDKGTSKACTT